MMTMCNAEIKSTLYPKKCPLFIGFNIFYVVVISTRAHVCHSLVPGNICISFCVITRKYIKLLVSYIQFNLLW